MAKLIPYNQLVIELDKLFFGTKLETLEQAEKQNDIIEAYLEATGYSWDDIIGEISLEEVVEIPARTDN